MSSGLAKEFRCEILVLIGLKLDLLAFLALLGNLFMFFECFGGDFHIHC